MLRNPYHINYENIPARVMLTGDIKTGNVYINDHRLYPAYSQRVRNHSPNGFSWGNIDKSGQRQLALAVMLYIVQLNLAVNIYDSFEEKFIAPLKKENFKLRLNMRAIIKDLIEETELAQM